MDSMRTFLTEENMLIHKEYMKTLRLKHSISEKSFPEIKDKSIFEIEKMRLPISSKEEILENLKDYLSHEIYFRSFSQNIIAPDVIKMRYSSPEAFLYEIYLLASEKNQGFIYVFAGNKGVPEIMHSDDIKRMKCMPRLALDISEHSYFLDYRFEKDRYIRSAISNMNLSLLDNT